MWLMSRTPKKPIAVNGNDSFGQRLRQYRRARGLTQEQLGESIGVSKRAVCSYERNECEPPVHVLVEIGNVLTVSVDELLGQSKQPTEPGPPIRRRWMKKFEELDKLPERKQQTILQVIDLALKSTP